MASKMFENLNAIVANTLTNDIKMINIDELHDSDSNFFNIERIEEFADTIQGQGGVKDNLLVRPLSTGGYEIISGHRRKAAIKYLLDKGENVSRYLPCLVQNYDDDDSKMLDLVLMNVSARQISDSELWKSYEIVNEILQRKKENGEKFGRIREKLSEILNVSGSQVKKLQNIKSHAIPAIKNAVENGDLSVCTANEIAKLDTNDQETIISGDKIENVKHKDVIQKRSGTRTTQNNPNKKELKNDAEKKCGTCTTKNNSIEEVYIRSENNSFQEIERNNYKRIASFIYEHYNEIDDVFETYTCSTNNLENSSMIEDFQNLLFKIKETEHDKRQQNK